MMENIHTVTEITELLLQKTHVCGCQDLVYKAQLIKHVANCESCMLYKMLNLFCGIYYTFYKINNQNKFSSSCVYTSWLLDEHANTNFILLRKYSYVYGKKKVYILYQESNVNRNWYYIKYSHDSSSFYVYRTCLWN